MNAPTSPSREMRAYSAEGAQMALLVLVDDHDPLALALDADGELESTKDSFISAGTNHLISEKKISLGAYPGIEFEAESNTAHFSARFYLVGKTLYKTLVVSPIEKPYADTIRFLDSFQLIPRTVDAAPGPPAVSTTR